MFKNKHIITALIVTPILAILGYFATDYLVSERPHKAQTGGQYQLAQLPNCRYASGQCGLKNGDFKVIVSGEAGDDGVLLLKLESVFALADVRASIVKDPAEIVGPGLMKPISADGKLWQAEFQIVQPQQQFLRLAISAGGAVYYAETAMPFLDYETSFHKDFRPE